MSSALDASTAGLQSTKAEMIAAREPMRSAVFIDPPVPDDPETYGITFPDLKAGLAHQSVPFGT
jgi:hypothetical protein